ncbi:leucine-rich repeat receptor-like protein kinase PXC1 [Triticum dicoccoides]|uniref:leucine-rich repeat receptor-like protein kinase PXC1 n=1 Tax=Triticum dicoccoides TaxID=85692 RepID=UPI0018901C1E|nr:leucine-rich repeat receptor-like protein kinase PXC1 [Triticum dicoccoides]
MALRFLAVLGFLSAAAAAAVPRPEPELKPSDTDALGMFRHGADAHGILAGNWSTPDACAGRWTGVGCSSDGRRVTSLSLGSLDLRGSLDPLSHLTELRVLDLRGNRLNGTLDGLLLGVPNLKLLYLSRNDFSGAVPDALARLPRLVRLDLADNSLRGPIPAAALANLTDLLTLRLQDNLLTGLLPDLATALPRLADFNASNNQLSGRVPDALWAKFGLASFAGNAGLCGTVPPLPSCSFMPREPAPTSPSAPASSTQSVVPSNPAASSSSSSVASSSPALATPEGVAGKGGLSTGAIAGIAVGNGLFLFALLSLLVAYCCCSTGGGSETAKKRKRGGRVGLEDGDGGMFGHGKGMQPARPGSAGRCSDGGDSDGARSKLVFFGVDGEGGGNDEADDDGGSDSSAGWRASGGWTAQQQGRRSKFELEELLRASAEMVGRGSLGTVYRAALSDGRMVAVKRLRDANPCARDEFHRYMDLIGRLRHPNLVPLRAFYYAKQEKLLIYDYLPNGNLHDRLHGHQMTGETPLDWTTRVTLLLSAARGLACIHREYRDSTIPHGNIKSTNVLLDKNGAACVTDFGLALLLSPAHAIARLGGYIAPEQSGDHKRLSQEADVYSFGVLVLEALTGKVPAQHLQPLPDAAGNSAQRKDKQAAVSLPEWVRSVVREEWTAEVFDAELLRYKNIEEEMVALLHIALACVAQLPEQRPSMADVVRMIESVPVDQSPLPEEDVSMSPSIGITTDDGLSY